MRGKISLTTSAPKRVAGFLAVFIALSNCTMHGETHTAGDADNESHSATVLRTDTDNHQHSHGSPAEESLPSTPEAATLDVAVAAKYTSLPFDEIFVTPSGPKGLEYTTNILALKGKFVRMTGFMVRHINKDPAVFMLTEFPVSTLEHEYGTVDSVPPNAVHVLLPEHEGFGTAWQPYAVTVYGQLELDHREEKDGRVSYVRIKADQITVGDNLQLIDVMRPLSERDVNLGAHHHQH